MNPFILKTSIALFLLLGSLNCAFPQISSSNFLLSGKPGNVQEREAYSLALRGKAVGFFVIEDAYFSTGTLGAELMLKGGHSFGVDLSFFYWRFESDDEQDNPLYENYEKRNYIQVDYKYRLFSLKEHDIYFNLYDKLGIFHSWSEGVTKGYTDWEQPFLTDKTFGTFNQVGLGLGVKKYFSDRFYLDVNVNGGKLFTKDHTLTYDSVARRSVEAYNVRNTKGIFYIRVNFGYILKGNYAMKPALKNKYD